MDILWKIILGDMKTSIDGMYGPVLYDINNPIL